MMLRPLADPSSPACPPDGAAGARTAADVARYASDDARWQAIVDRDPKADGHFVYGVRTTRVYAPPSGAARRPNRRNVVYFASAEAARAAGFRPSLRAGADREQLARLHREFVVDACRAIEAAGTPPRLDELAARAGISPFHLHRLFKAQTGLTPKAYADAHRARRLREELGEAPTITDAVYGAGFNSNSRFYEQSRRLLGMPARTWREGGQSTPIRFAVGLCSLGSILVACSPAGVCAIMLGDDPQALIDDLQRRFSNAALIGADARFERWVAEIVGLVEAPSLGTGLPLDVRGTAFQQRVWQALREIPPGQTITYARLAQRIGEPRAVRAVAQACAANPLAVAIPCHRVIRTDGGLSGYRWGVERKRALLSRERD
ncbi:MAG: bifunctional DNA-binding transcriptional regulator/O6-methylguanine-DNA methyltransferase Ada [Burkholderiaceae bacterium]